MSGPTKADIHAATEEVAEFVRFNDLEGLMSIDLRHDLAGRIARQRHRAVVAERRKKGQGK